MKKILPTCKTVILLSSMYVVTLPAGYSRAHAHQPAHKTTVVSEPRKLRDILEDLKKHYQIDFLIEGGLLDNQLVSSSLVDYSQSLERNLDNVLKPAQLQYRKAKNGVYLILKAKRPSRRETSESSAINTEPLPLPVAGNPALTSPAGLTEDITVTGKVTDEKGEGLPGVSIVIRGSQRGTVTNNDGSFRITVPSRESVLSFSFVGYRPEEIVVGNQSSLTILLKADPKSLEEVVVVGYGEQAKKELTTAIAKISGKDINRLPVATPGEALAGLAAGVQVQSGRGGDPGQAPVIRIRGVGSLGASNEPLFVVDGYPLQNSAQFSRINPSDIESIEILKDAASAAIYGSRAANGVVIVTTKRGKAGKTQFELSAYTGFQQVAKTVEVMNKEEYLTFAKQSAAVNGVRYPDIFDQPDKLADTDWQDVIFRRAPMSEVQLTASGGTEKTRFSVSGSYLSQTGTLIGTDFKLGTMRVNLDADLSPRLKVGVNFAPSYAVRNIRPAGGSYNSTGDGGFGTGLPSPIYSALLMPPIIPVRLSNGNYGQANADPAFTQYGYLNAINNLYNPLAVLELTKNRASSLRLLNTGFLVWEPLKGLSIRTQAGISAELTSQEIYVPPTLSYDGAPTASLSSPNLNGIASQTSNDRTLDWVWENTLTYTKRLQSGHNFSLLGLYSLQKFNSLSTTVAGRTGTFTTDLVQNPSASPDLVGGLGYGLNSFMSYAGRLNYDFKGRYLLSAAIRSDGSSRFGPGNRFGTFPSFSVGWRVGEEAFMQHQRTVSELKLRASYGETGNANIGNFSWLSGIGATNYSFNGQRVFGTQQSGYANPNLTWEKNQQIDLGLEVAFLQDRIYLTVDLYRKITQGMLFAKDLPAIVGFATNYQTNIGKIRNQGLEVALTTRNVSEGFKWTTDFNVAYNESLVMELGGRQSLNPLDGTTGWANVYRIEVGKPIGNIYGFLIDGVFKNQAELDAGAKWVGGSQVGDLKARDLNGDKVINESDRALLGNGLPKFTFGMTNRLTYRNFDFSFILQGTQGNSIINGNARHGEAESGRFNAVKGMVNNYFLASDPDRNVKYARNNRSGLTGAGQLTSYAVYNGSFLRGRNLTLGYTVPVTLAKKANVQSARLYVSAQNVFTLTRYPGYNPEPSQYGDSVYQPGSDQGTYPANRTLTAGITIGF